MDDFRVTIEFTPDEVKQIAASVEFHFQNWPGYPAAEKEEQVMLWHLRDLLRMALMEVAFARDDD